MYIYIINSYYIILKHILIVQNETLMVFQKQSNLAKKNTSIRPEVHQINLNIRFTNLGSSDKPKSYSFNFRFIR